MRKITLELEKRRKELGLTYKALAIKSGLMPPCYRRWQEGGCVENEYGECHIWRAIQKARGQG